MGMFKLFGETNFNIMSSKNQSHNHIIIFRWLWSLNYHSFSICRYSFSKRTLSRLVDQQWDLSIIVAECVPPCACASVYACVCVCVLHLMSFQCLTWSVCRLWHMYTHVCTPRKAGGFCPCHDRWLAPSGPLTPVNSLADPAEAVRSPRWLKEAHHPKLACWIFVLRRSLLLQSEAHWLFPVSTQISSVASNNQHILGVWDQIQDAETKRISYERRLLFLASSSSVSWPYHDRPVKALCLVSAPFLLKPFHIKWPVFLSLSLSLSRNNSRKYDQKWPPSTFCCHLFWLQMDIIKSWSSFNIHPHNRSRTVRVRCVKGRRVCYRQWLPPWNNAAQAGTYNYLFIMHPLKHKCTLLSHSASYFTHKPGNGLGF